MKNLLIAGALAFALFAVPAAAQECETIDHVQAAVESGGFPFMRVPDDELAAFLEAIAPAIGGVVPEGVTAAVVAMIGETPVFGLEINGCMSPPIPFPALV